MSRIRHARLLVAALLVAATGAASFAADVPVTREEFDQMVKDLKVLHQEVTDLRREKAAAATTGGTPSATAPAGEVAALRREVADLKKQLDAGQQDADARNDEIDKMIKDVMREAKSHAVGETKLLITGDAAVGFDAHRHNDSTFYAGASPRFLWKINDRLQFDAALDINIGRDDGGNNATTVDLTIASITYLVNDYLVVGGGLFVAPFGSYHRQYDPPWINKLPDDPLVFSDGGLAPGSVLGAFISGAYPIGPTKINYAFYGSNGPALITNDPTAAGSLDFSNYTDLNNNKAFGGRIGFLPVPEMEFGYSFLCGQASPDGFPNTHAFLQAVDFNYSKEIEWMAGTFTARAEWVWSHVPEAAYSGTNPDNTPWAVAPYPNNRSGGYAMLAYRPSLVDNKILRNFELVFRYDRMDVNPQAPGGQQEQRWTTGIDYWLDARSVLKFAYECDDIAHDSGSRGIMFQFGVGF